MQYKIGTYKKAKQGKFLKEFACVLLLKESFSSSFIKRGSLRIISEITGYSYSYLSSKIIPKLISLGFLERLEKNGVLWGYKLISYHNLFISTKTNQSKLFRFSPDTNTIAGILSVLEGLELAHNFDKQLNKKFTKSLIAKQKRYSLKQDTEKLNLLDQMYYNRFFEKARCYETENQKRAKITCKKFSKILGYKSAMKGSRVLNQAKENGFIQIEKRKKFICETDHDTARESFDFKKHFFVKNNIFSKQGTVFLRQVSDIVFNPFFFVFANIKNCEVPSKDMSLNYSQY